MFYSFKNKKRPFYQKMHKLKQLPWEKLFLPIVATGCLTKVFMDRPIPTITYDEKSKTVSIENWGRKRMTIVDVEISVKGVNKIETLLKKLPVICNGGEKMKVFQFPDDVYEIGLKTTFNYYGMITHGKSLTIVSDKLMKPW